MEGCCCGLDFWHAQGQSSRSCLIDRLLLASFEHYLNVRNRCAWIYYQAHRTYSRNIATANAESDSKVRQLRYPTCLLLTSRLSLIFRVTLQLSLTSTQELARYAATVICFDVCSVLEELWRGARRLLHVALSLSVHSSSLSSKEVPIGDHMCTLAHVNVLNFSIDFACWTGFARVAWVAFSTVKYTLLLTFGPISHLRTHKPEALSVSFSRLTFQIQSLGFVGEERLYLCWIQQGSIVLGLLRRCSLCNGAACFHDGCVQWTAWNEWQNVSSCFNRKSWSNMEVGTPRI